LPKRKSSSEVRRRLLDAGAELIAGRGFAATNSNQIAKTAGVGVGSFYSHFPDKHRLLEQILGDFTHALRERSLAASADSRELEAQVRALVEAAVGLAEEQPERFRVAAAYGRRRAGVRLSSRPVEQRLAQLRSAGKLDPGLDPGVAAKAFEVMQIGVLDWWLGSAQPAPRAAIVETLVRLHPALSARVAR